MGMNQEDVIRMAREAGMPIDDDSFIFQATRERVTRFAAMVAAAEREACAKVCEENADRWLGTRFGGYGAAYQCASAIRERVQE